MGPGINTQNGPSGARKLRSPFYFGGLKMKFGYERAISAVVGAVLILISQLGSAATADEFLRATPVGSWQAREEITTDAKGKQTVMVVKTSLVESVNYEGAPHYWVESVMESFKIKKGKRKPVGKPMVIKALVDASMMSSKPQNVAGNLQKYGREIIMQQGDQDPMRISEGGAFAQMMMKSMGVKVDYDYQDGGEKTVDVPAGQFKCTNLKGKGNTEVKILVQTLRVQGEVETCVSERVPFGIVYYQSRSTTNGKTSTTEAKLTEFGKSGAVSRITKAPVDAPQMPKLF